MTDYSGIPLAELEEIRAAVNLESKRRRLLSGASAEVARLEQAVAVASGVSNGMAWKPLDVLGYPLGWEVVHKGKRWRSTMATNVWEPGVSGWRQVMPDGSPAPYSAPTGAHDAYEAGEIVTWGGKTWAAVRNGVAHSPGEAPVEWREVPAPPVGPPVTPPVDPGTTPNPPDPVDPNAPAPWIPAGKAYVAGNRVTYDGKTYLVRQNHTSQAHFPPPAVLSLYLPE